MSDDLAPIEVLCSYADKIWLRKLETYLGLLKYQGLITTWHHRLIPPSTDWARALDTHLESASVILLLISVDFLASDYRCGGEMKRAVGRQSLNEGSVIPISVPR